MIRPRQFGFDPQTAATNTFQEKSLDDGCRVSARQEFDSAVIALRQNGVKVKVFDDVTDRDLPDAVFPNNWFSTQPATKALVLYPMMSSVRAQEVRHDIVDYIKANYQVSALESTGCTRRLKTLKVIG